MWTPCSQCTHFMVTYIHLQNTYTILEKTGIFCKKTFLWALDNFRNYLFSLNFPKSSENRNLELLIQYEVGHPVLQLFRIGNRFIKTITKNVKNVYLPERDCKHKRPFMQRWRCPIHNDMKPLSEQNVQDNIVF